MQAASPPELRALRINMILKVIVKGGRRRQGAWSRLHWGHLGRWSTCCWPGAGRQCGPCQLPPWRTARKQERSQCLEHSLSEWGWKGYTKYPEFMILAPATQACIDSLFLRQPPCLPTRANLEKRKVTASKNISLWSHYLLPTHGVEPSAAWVCPRKLYPHSS